MSIYSMTGYGRSVCSTGAGDLVWEIRSVNHRHLDLHIKLPEAFRSLEMAVRKQCKQLLRRGKIDIYLSSKFLNAEIEHQLNPAALASLQSLVSEATNAFGQLSQCHAIDILKWPGILKSESLDVASIEADLIASLAQGIEELLLMRRQEGEQITSVLSEKISGCDSLVQGAEKEFASIHQALKAKVAKLLDEVAVECDETRLAQEIAIQSMRYDVSEELDRLKAHGHAFRALLSSSEPAGRRMEFLLQEMNREANTLGNKSMELNQSALGMELKVLIEQMREQACNVE